MELTVRKLSNADYDSILVGWWLDWGMTPPDRSFLPECGAGGVIVFDGETPVCAGFMYATNSGIAWVDWVITNKQYRGAGGRREAIDLLVASLTETAKLAGYMYVYTLFKNRHLVDYFSRAGYAQGGSYTGEMIKSF